MLLFDILNIAKNNLVCELVTALYLVSQQNVCVCVPESM